ncbi:acyl-CoA thioester hydrolase [Rhodoblastus acidophilus]|uniref:Acyl-CoA thioester hydrolase n=1 Tax=Rhodoblastus acidophilus TaxID=1074 RepID=A0A212QEG8_RHOAC|nr:thioesterase family protein [Rhodoblastus acidophilus]PPQ40030.1 thioesterase [Rhodoblastus acidophilus]RAI22327.1 thioesterase [Rhodoblastus acidophilus]SNB57735.1 acyl-CoA thioester hydrolase [Rhodoblastus acidophilus]
MSEKPILPVLAEFPFRTRDKLRYGDTDRQGHVNNAVFATFFETARVDMLMAGGVDLMGEGGAFVLARLVIDFVQEINWPGEVEIGTRITSVGRSSLRLDHAVFDQGVCAARGESVVVLTDTATRKSKPFSDWARAWLEARLRA